MPAFFPASRSYLYCSLAIFLPLTSLAEDTLVVTAKPADTAETATRGYEASTSQGATKTDRPWYSLRNPSP